MKKAVLAILGTYLLGFWGSAFGEPFEAFRGIPWGADKKEVSGLIAGPQKEGVEVFTRNEKQKVGDIEVESIFYLFYKGKFGAAMITFQGNPRFSAIQDALRQKYGPGKKPDPSREKYLWDSEDLKITLSFSPDKDSGSVDYFFQPIVEQREKDRTKDGERKIQRRMDDL
jgi:hypothetical protein